MSIDKHYQPSPIETDCLKAWDQQQLGSPNPGNRAKGNYCIVIPPPNVTGTLHMGHGFQMTLMDALIRYHRAKGKHTLWQMGTDHAGIATQMVVEKQLHEQGKTKHDLGRKAFVDAIWAWRENSGSTINNQIKRLGASVDWSSERFTMDASYSSAVIEAFIKLHEEGMIYQGQCLVNLPFRPPSDAGGGSHGGDAGGDGGGGDGGGG